MADWATISALATAGGTLALAVATYGAVRSSNRSARIAELALQEQRRPVLVHARLDDPAQKLVFFDGHWIHAGGGEGVIDEEAGTVYLGLSIRNVGAGIAVLQGWFGLSQLHQLRGRVGRGAHQSHCVLLYQYPISQLGKDRLAALAATNDGFEIAERDLQLRGPGDFFGTRQSGLPTLRTGDLVRDHSLMEKARAEAVRYLESSATTPTMLESLRQTWPTRFGLMDVG